MNGNVGSRSLHDVGLGAWFGGSLAGAVGFNGGAATAKDPAERTQLASAAWSKWAPVNLAAIAAHLVGGTGVIAGNAGRLASQRGVVTTSAIKIAVTGAALGATAYAGILGREIAKKSPQPSDGVTEPGDHTSQPLASLQRREKVMQWAVPALTGSLMLFSAYMGEQQRPSSVLSGVLERAGKGVHQ